MSSARDVSSLSNAYGNLPKNLRQLEMSPTWLQNILRDGVIWAGIAMLGVTAFSIISFIGAPFALTVLINAWFAGSAIYLSGLSYGIINDLIGVHKNLPYFSLGHQPHQKSLIKSNDKTTVGIAWGIFATSGLSLLAGGVFTIATLMTGFIGLPFAGFIFPLLAIALPIALVSAHLYSSHKEKQREQNEPYTKRMQHFKSAIDSNYSGLNPYQNDHLKYWLQNTNDVNAWLGNSDRNVFGYIAIPLLGIAGLAGMVTLSAVSSFLPAILFGAAFSVFPAVGLGILLAVSIAAACIYLAANHNKIVDNGYRLDPAEEPKESIHQTSTNAKLAKHMPENKDEKSHDNDHEPSPLLGDTASSSDSSTAAPLNTEVYNPRPPL